MKPRKGYKVVEVPDENFSDEYRKEEAQRIVMNGIAAFAAPPQLDPMMAGLARAKEFLDYFPGTQEIEPDGAWIMVTYPPPSTEFTVPPLSMWFSTPWPQSGIGGYPMHRVKIVTPRGTLGVYPHEYSKIDDITKYLPFIGDDGLVIKFFGGVDGLPKDALFYLRSRGISKADAVVMLLGHVKSHGVCWIEAPPQICAAFGMDWPDAARLATTTTERKETK
jgi:hypothetical protein